jgi:hypothetical protein
MVGLTFDPDLPAGAVVAAAFAPRGVAIRAADPTTAAPVASIWRREMFVSIVISSFR